MKKTIELLHLAAQYLSATGISFVDKQADDSHTNLDWDTENRRFLTHTFGDDFQVSFILETLTLEWLHKNRTINSIKVHGNTHEKIIDWFSECAVVSLPGQSYSYNFHYDLPYPPIVSNYLFFWESSDDIKSFADNLTIAKFGMSQFLSENKIEADIRLWPHHFDLGIYAPVNDNNSIFVGAGLAMPDELKNELYYYGAGWKDGIAIDHKKFKALEIGQWQENWHGAILLAEKTIKTDVFKFLNQILKQILDEK